MANVIKCPVCGESNLPDQEFCQYCQARLQPLTGKLKGADKPLTPGQIPTKKNTAELEPILPQWLREARSSARQASEEEAAQAAQQPPAPSPSPASSGSDLLAGLRSQVQDNDEDETPDWLASITGITPKTKKSQQDSSEVRWVEMGDTNDFAQSEQASDTPDWLKGLDPSASQPEEKIELTDWTQDAGDSQKNQQSSQPFSFDAPSSFSTTNESTETPDWLHSMVADDGSFNETENTGDQSFVSSDTPDWLRAMDAESAAQSTGGLSVPSDSSDTPDWLHAMDAENVAPDASAPSVSPVSSDTPDWLRAMDAESAAQNASVPSGNLGMPPVSPDTPDWLRGMDAENAALNTSTSSVPSASSDIPDWLRGMDSGSAVQNTSVPSGNSGMPPVSSDTPDWLRAMDVDKTQEADSAGFSEAGAGASGAALQSAEYEPDWLKGLEPSAPQPDQDWLKGLQSDRNQQPEQGSTQPALPATHIPEPEQTPAAFEQDDLDIPSWLKAAAPQSSIFDEPVVKSEAPSSTPSDTSDWLNAFKSADAPDAQVSAFSMENTADSVPSTFPDAAQSDANADVLFTEMPDWLSLAGDSPSTETAPAPATNADAIVPSDLPSWVQAMRPVDANVSQPSSTSSADNGPLESRGALAGLQGVLPAVLGFSPTSRPKAYSIKMNASEEQQAHAVLLEQILEAETAPVPIGAFSKIGTSRGLRWALAFLLFVVLTFVLFMQTQIFSMPVGLSSEVKGALTVAQSIPEGAPVLVVFDYESARVGEMEAVAAPMFDQMILLRHPRMSFIATNVTGAILAERFISSGPLAGHNYQNGTQYLNLGYLPGGQMGIRAFVQNPRVAAPYAVSPSSTLFNTTLTPAWDLPPLQGVTSLSQFAALILITDNADSARVWIEQTKTASDPISTIPFVVVSSAQSAPMIQPYYAAQQINGLIGGLYGGALFEQNNAGRPGTLRTYWDAYSIGMLLSMALIVCGGLLNLGLGLRDRAAAREAK